MVTPTNNVEPIDPQDVDIHPDPIIQKSWNEEFQVEGNDKNSTSPGVVNLAVGNDGTLYANSPNTPPAPVVIPRVSVEGAEWVFSGTFSSSDADMVAWGAGTLTTEDGHTYAIGASNTGNMAAKTYIYFDVDVSTTAFQTTTTAGDSVGAGKILIAVAQNATGEAKYMVLNDNQYNIDAANIVANSITANELSTSITYAGSIVIDSAGLIRSGQTAYNTGTGWWIGNDSGTPKLSIGVSSGDSMTWDGSRLRAVGTINTNIPLTTYQEFTGATTPVPVLVNALGQVQVSDANVAQLSKAVGLVNTTTTNIYPDEVNSSGDSVSFSPSVQTSFAVDITANAGTDRVLIVQIQIQGGSLTQPTGVTWGGNAMTLIDGDNVGGGSNYNHSVWYRAIGTSGSNQTASLSITGTSFTCITYNYFNFDKVNQSDPFGSSLQSTGSGTTQSSTITPERAPTRILSLIGFDSEATTLSFADGQTRIREQVSDLSGKIDSGAVLWVSTGSNAFNTTSGGSVQYAYLALELLGAGQSVSVRVGGSMDGFSGLTVGSTYYVSDTEGVLSTTPGSTTIAVGKAISATELLIIQTA